ncbi:hypothetical protein VNO77_01638 [Canavalia gladiata]|uniref:Uncharacterized protein n=1 Tax=Canavalia gladiata TaxID=3824 RepID=A0AAN9R5E7_CANGL
MWTLQGIFLQKGMFSYLQFLFYGDYIIMLYGATSLLIYLSTLEFDFNLKKPSCNLPDDLDYQYAAGICYCLPNIAIYHIRLPWCFS